MPASLTVPCVMGRLCGQHLGRQEVHLQRTNVNHSHKQYITTHTSLYTEGGRTGRECLECCETENERQYQGEDVQNSGKTSTDVRGRDMGVEEGTGNEIGGRRNAIGTMDVRSYEAGQDQK